MFVKKEGPVDAPVATTSGQFTADAELSASFMGPHVAMKDNMTISGTVTGFEDSDGKAIARWTVKLGITGIASDALHGRNHRRWSVERLILRRASGQCGRCNHE